MEKEDRKRDMEKTDSRRERERPQRRGSRRDKRGGDENRSVCSKRSAHRGSEKKDSIRSERREQRCSVHNGASVGGGSYRSKRSQRSRSSRGGRSCVENDLAEKIGLLLKELKEEKDKIVEIQEGLDNDALSEDIYSMLMISKPLSSSFLYSLMILFFQLATYVLILYNVFQTKSFAEYLNPPINAPQQVRWRSGLH